MGEKETIRDEDVVAITKAEGESSGYIVHSLVEPDGEARAQGKPPFILSSTHKPSLNEQVLTRHSRPLPAQLDSGESHIYVLVSVKSGLGQAELFFETVVEPVVSAVGLKETDYSVIWTQNANTVREFARSILQPNAERGRKQTVLLLSGDGGIVDIVNALLEKGGKSSQYVKPVISQFPLGTGNAVFNSTHRIPTDAQEHVSVPPSIYVQGLRTLLRGQPRPLPIFKATFSPGARLLSDEGRIATPLQNNTLYGAVVASYGLHSTLVADSDTTEYRKHGDKRFGLVAKDLLFPEDGSLPHAYQAQVSLFKSGSTNPVQLPSSEHGYILASLVSNLERTFTISPANRPLDRQLHLVHFPAVSGKQAMEIMTKAYDSGKHVDVEWETEDGVKQKVDYEAIDGLRIDFNEPGESWKWRRCCIDGLTVAIEEGGWVEIRIVEEGGEVVDVAIDVTAQTLSKVEDEI